MRASDFEYRHQMLLHILLVGAALLAYVFSPDDIVWALVRHHANGRSLERRVFGIGAIMLLGSAALETWAAYTQRQLSSGSTRSAQLPFRSARLLLAFALGLLLPLPGTILLLSGELILVLRLILRDRATLDARENGSPTAQTSQGVRQANGAWGAAFRAAASKWGLAGSMIVFTLTLQDRIAEIGAAGSFILWLILNFRRPSRS